MWGSAKPILDRDRFLVLNRKMSTSESPAIPEDTPSSAETAKHSAPLPTPAECHSEKG
jgi:hypothetical protein